MTPISWPRHTHRIIREATATILKASTVSEVKEDTYLHPKNEKNSLQEQDGILIQPLILAP
jgi:hypothetical protein